MSGHHAIALFPQTTFHRKADPGGVNSAGIGLVSGAEPLGMRSYSNSSPGVSPVASAVSSAVAANPAGKWQPPTPIRRGDNDLHSFVGLPPPPPPSLPPPRKSNKQRLRSQSTPRPFRQGVSLALSMKDSIVEERMRAARMTYQPNNDLLVDPMTSGSDLISDSHSMPAASSSVSASVAASHQSDPPDIAEWGRPSTVGTPKTHLRVVAMAEDEQSFIIPVPPVRGSPMHHHAPHQNDRSADNNSSSAITEPVRNIPLSPNHRSGASPLGSINKQSPRLRNSASKSPSTSVRPKSPDQPKLHATTPERTNQHSGVVPAEAAILVSSARRNTRSKSPTNRLLRPNTPDKLRSKTPERTSKSNGAPEADNGNSASRSSPIKRLRARTPEKLRLRPKTPESKKERSSLPHDESLNSAATKVSSRTNPLRRKTPEKRQSRPKKPDNKNAGIDRKNTASSTATTPSEKQPKRGFFRKLFAKKGKTTSEVDKAASQDVSLAQSSDVKSTRVDSFEGLEIASRSSRSTRSVAQRSATASIQNSGIHQSRSGSISQSFEDHHIENSGVHQSRSGSISQNFVNHHEVLAENIPTVHDDRPEMFYVDDISTLTYPTMEGASFGFGASNSFGSRRQDPSVRSGASSDPMGRYWNKQEANNREAPAAWTAPSPLIDPFREPFFAEPDGESPVVGNRVTKKAPDLQVTVPSALYDPAGESPLKSSRRSPVVTGQKIQDPSPQGYQTGYQTPVFMEFPIQDPVGESPLHKNGRGPSALLDGSPLAQDPPLYLHSLDAAELVSEGSSITSYSVEEKKGEAARAHSNTSHIGTKTRLPSSPSVQRMRAPIPRSPVQRMESDVSSQGSYKETISSYSPRVLPPSPLNFQQVPSDGDGNSVATTPKARNTFEFSAMSEPDEKASDKTISAVGEPKSPQAIPRVGLMQKARDHSPRSRLECSRESISPSVSGASSTQSANFALEKSKQHLTMSTAVRYSPSRSERSPPCDRESNSSSASNASSTASEVSAVKAKKRFTMSTAARVNARAVAYLHNLNGEPSPRNYWHGAESDSEVSSPAMVGLLSNGAFLGSPKLQTSHRDGESRNSRLFSSYSSGKFKNRKLGATPANANSSQTLAQENGPSKLSDATTNLQKDPSQTKIASAESKGQSKCYNALAMSLSKGALSEEEVPSNRSQSISKVASAEENDPSKRHLSLSKVVSSEDKDPSKGNGAPNTSPFKVVSAAVAKNTTFLVDINECFPEFTGSSSFEKSREPLTNQRAIVGEKSDDQVPTLFSAYSARRRKPAPDSMKTSVTPPMIKADGGARELPNRAVDELSSLKSDAGLTNFAVIKGFEMLREQREHDIATGIAYRILPSSHRKVPAVNFSLSRAEDVEPKDPIQRAGRRLLAKAAVPIQAAARRFLAQQEAVDRMWALLELQSYARRWRAEASLLASIISALTIQAIVRGFLARLNHRVRQKSATLIQKVVRGHLVAAQTYDLVYRIIVVQAQARGWVTRLRIRRHLAKFWADAQLKSTCKLQTWWRARSSRMLYQFLLVDTVIAQSAARRYLAIRQVSALRHVRAIASATKIQAAWRGFQGYTDYIFCLVDIMLAQRTIRAWFAKKEVQERRVRRASIRIQSLWRRYSAFSKYVDYRAAATIQKEWRRYSAYSKYESYRAAVLLQKKWRCHIAYSKYKSYRAAQMIQKEWRCHNAYATYKIYRAAVLLQKSWRCHILYSKYRRYRAARTIQKEWRCYSAATDYIFALADIIRIQQAVRFWHIEKKENARKTEDAALKIQTSWRAHIALVDFVSYKSATKIQKHWRRHRAYVQYIFSVAYVIIVQRTARSYIAKNELRARRWERSAVTIQKHWRRYNSQMLVLRDLARIILVQSVARRYAARRVAHQLRMVIISAAESASATKIQATWRGFWQLSHYVISAAEAASAVKIQATWRGFWQFSHFVILQYEVVRMQSMIRGKMFRKDFSLQLGCCIMIQSAVRRFLTMQKLKSLNIPAVLTRGRALAIRERLSGARIQYWWRVVLECRKEKKAALIIERFFLMIKREIEREIKLRETLKQEKRKQRRRKKREEDDKLLERVWLNTLDSHTDDVFSFTTESGSDVFDFSPKAGVTPRLKLFGPGSPSPVPIPAASSMKAGTQSPSGQSPHQRLSIRSVNSSMSPQQPSTGRSVNSVASPQMLSQGRSFGHRASSPPKRLIMRHEYDLSPLATSRPKSARNSGYNFEENKKSAVSPLRRAKALTKAISRPPAELTENLSLEEAFLDAEVHQEKERKKAIDRYSEKYGIRTAPHRTEYANHFFADDLESLDDGDGSTLLGEGSAILTVFSRAQAGITGPPAVSTRSATEAGRSDRARSSSRQKHSGASRSSRQSVSSASRTHGSPSQKKSTTRPSPRHGTGPNESLSQRTSATRPSPRHGKILVMNPYPDYPKKVASHESMGEVEYDGEEFGMI